MHDPAGIEQVLVGVEIVDAEADGDDRLV